MSLISTSLRALAVALPLAAPSPGASPGATTPSVTAALEGCVATAGQADRSATFSGQMVAIAGTQRMAMRIDVQARAPADTTFHTISAPGLGVWRRSAPGVKIYKYLKQVTNLTAPASYRAVVRFRWFSAHGRVVKRGERRTAVCEQPDERPRLVVAQVLATGLAGSALADYRILVRNEGRGPAGAFKLTLSVGAGQQAARQQVPLEAPALEAGAHAQLRVEAPRCAAQSSVEVALDPEHLVEEAPGGGLSDTLPCPLGAGESA